MTGVTLLGTLALTSEQREIQSLKARITRLEMEKEPLKQATVLMSELTLKSVC